MHDPYNPFAAHELLAQLLDDGTPVESELLDEAVEVATPTDAELDVFGTDAKDDADLLARAAVYGLEEVQ
jgi:hypothetical protein